MTVTKKSSAIVGLTLFGLALVSQTSFAKVANDWANANILKATGLVTGLQQNQKEVIANRDSGSELSKSLNELIGNELWRNQQDIREDLNEWLMRAVRIDFDLIEKGDFTAEFSLSPRRQVYFYNNPLIETQSATGAKSYLFDTKSPSKYVVFNSMTARLKGEARLVGDIIDDKADLNLDGEVGANITYIQHEDSPRSVTQKADELPITRDQLESVSASTLKKNGFFRKLGRFGVKVFNGIEAAIAKQGGKLVDEDSSLIFLDKNLDAFRLPGKIPVDETVLAKMKDGEILSVSLFYGAGPEIEFESGVWNSAIERIYRVAYQVTIKKIDENRVQVQPLITIKKGWEFTPVEASVDFELGPLNLSYTPFYVRNENGNTYNLESEFVFDLSNNQEKKAFDEILSFSFGGAKEALTKGRNRAIELVDRKRTRVNLNLFLAKFKSERIVDTIKRTEIASDGSTNTSWTGDSQAYGYSYLWKWKNRHERAFNTRSCVTSALDSQGDVPGSHNDSSQNMFLAREQQIELSDRNANLDTVKRMLGIAKLSVLPANSSEQLISNERLKSIESFHKNGRKTKRTLQVTTWMDRHIVGAVLDISKDEFYRLALKSMLVNPNQSFTSDRARSLYNEKDRYELMSILSDIRLKRRSSNPFVKCAVTPAFSYKIKDGGKVRCDQVLALASGLANSFEIIRNAKTDEERLKEFARAGTAAGPTPIINQILIAAYTLKYGQAPKVRYAVTLSGPIGSGAFRESNTPEVASRICGQDNRLGDLQYLSRQDEVITDAEIFRKKGDNSSLYLAVTALPKANSKVRMTVWVADFKVARKDKPIFIVVVDQLKPIESVNRYGETAYTYEVQLPQEIKSHLKRGLDVGVRFENEKGEPLTELASIPIKL